MKYTTCIFCQEPLQSIRNDYKPWKETLSCGSCCYFNPLWSERDQNASRCIFIYHNENQLKHALILFHNQILLSVDQERFQIGAYKESGHYVQLANFDVKFDYQHDLQYLQDKIKLYLAFL